jgi:site-specific recombinase XerD
MLLYYLDQKGGFKMSVKLRKKKTKKGESLYLDIYHNGQREYEFLKIHLTKDKASNKEKMRIAESLRAKKELEILSGAHGITPKFKKNANFVEYFEKFTIKKNQRYYKATLKYLKEFTGGAIKFLQINDKWLEEFKYHLLIKVTKNSANIYFAVLKTSLKQAVKEKIIHENPSQYIDTIKTNEVKRTYLTIDELNKLSCTKCPNNEVKRAFLFACYTGLRISDLKKLTWGKIQPENGRHKLQYRQKKTGGFEYFPLSETASKLLSDDSNIINLPNKPVFELPSKVHYNLLLKQWAKKAGIKKNLSSHVARHTFATLALTNGVDLYTVSKLLGHRDIATTQIYAKIIDKKKEEAVDMLPPLQVNLG